MTPPDEALSSEEVLKARRLRERSRQLLAQSRTLRQGLGEVVARITARRDALRLVEVLDPPPGKPQPNPPKR